MLHKTDFALEQLEERLETFCINIGYVGVCYKSVWGIPIAYPCIKYKWICF
jgi:hypothetical protein